MITLFPLIFLLLIVDALTMTNVTVYNPQSLIEQIKSLYPKSNSSIPNSLGNFGDVPYGSTIIGYVVLHYNTDQTNYWCDRQKLSRPYLPLTPGQSPVFLVDHSHDCPYSTKAYNVRQMGGAVMMLISDDNDLMEEYNSDSEFGFVPDIPTIIIPKNIGELFKETIKNQQSADHKIILSIKFNAVLDNSNLLLELFFRSDDVKALGFFKEFQPYAERLRGKLTFVPVYKYNKFNSNVEYKGISKYLDNPCVKGYCTGKNNDLQITSPRIVLRENILQSCIYTKSQDAYWNYMVSFFELCADIYTPTFNPECSRNALKSIGLYSEIDEINNCIDNMMNENDTNTKIEQDYELYEKKKVYKVPELIINGIKYKGQWHGRYIFNAICNGFINDEKICRPQTLEEVKKSNYSNVKIFFTVIIILVIVMVILLLCYRRIVDKAINADFNERIGEQTRFSIEQRRYNNLAQVKSESA